MIHNRKEREVVRALNETEPEAIPLQWIGRCQYKIAPFGWCHLAMPDRHKINVGRITDGMPNDGLRIAVLEPTVVGAVPTKVRVDDVTHRSDIAPTWYVPRPRD